MESILLPGDSCCFKGVPVVSRGSCSFKEFPIAPMGSLLLAGNHCPLGVPATSKGSLAPSRRWLLLPVDPYLFFRVYLAPRGFMLLQGGSYCFKGSLLLSEVFYCSHGVPAACRGHCPFRGPFNLQGVFATSKGSLPLPGVPCSFWWVPATPRMSLFIQGGNCHFKGVLADFGGFLLLQGAPIAFRRSLLLIWGPCSLQGFTTLLEGPCNFKGVFATVNVFCFQGIPTFSWESFLLPGGVLAASWGSFCFQGSLFLSGVPYCSHGVPAALWKSLPFQGVPATSKRSLQLPRGPFPF